MESSPAAFLSRSTNDAIGLDQRAAEPFLLFVADKLLHVGHQLLVLLRLEGQLLQPGDVLLEVITALLWNALLVSAAFIVRHVEQRWRFKVYVVI